MGMKKNKFVFPEDVRKIFAERDHLLVNELSDDKGAWTCSKFDDLKGSGFKYYSGQFECYIKPYIPWKK
jgi:hypothetical protein